MNNIKRYRKIKNFTQKELAELTGVSVVTISKLENNDSYNISLINMKRIAKALNTTVQELFFSEEER